MLLTPIMVLLMIPPVRPFNLFFTYVVPLVPLMVRWDGVVSPLRTYDAHELRALATSVPHSDRFRGDAGEVALNGPIPVTYLIGLSNG